MSDAIPHPVNHVYVHPSREAAVREWMAELGITGATLHIDPTCPPESAHFCEHELPSLEEQDAALPNEVRDAMDGWHEPAPRNPEAP